MYPPRKSRVLTKLRAGKKAVSFKLNLSCPREAEIVALHGFDAVWICQEHVPTDNSVMEAQIMAAKIRDADTIVRVRKGCYSDYIVPLEADASGIMIPHLMSADEAREIVRTVRFQPLGRRPIDGGNADGLYCGLPVAEYIRFANENRMVIVQIEDPEVLTDLEEICRMPGIDMIFFGPGDFSHAIGVPGEYAHPEVVRARRLVVETAHRHGKFAGTVSVPSPEVCFSEGYDLVNIGSDVKALSSACSDAMSSFLRCRPDSANERDAQ